MVLDPSLLYLNQKETNSSKKEIFYPILPHAWTVDLIPSSIIILFILGFPLKGIENH